MIQNQKIIQNLFLLKLKKIQSKKIIIILNNKITLNKIYNFNKIILIQNRIIIFNNKIWNNKFIINLNTINR